MFESRERQRDPPASGGEDAPGVRRSRPATHTW
jgi:hypothetical protein